MEKIKLNTILGQLTINMLENVPEGTLAELRDSSDEKSIFERTIIAVAVAQHLKMTGSEKPGVKAAELMGVNVEVVESGLEIVSPKPAASALPKKNKPAWLNPVVAKEEKASGKPSVGKEKAMSDAAAKLAAEAAEADATAKAEALIAENERLAAEAKAEAEEAKRIAADNALNTGDVPSAEEVPAEAAETDVTSAETAPEAPAETAEKKGGIFGGFGFNK
jgi:colicin import membrane protein